MIGRKCQSAVEVSVLIFLLAVAIVGYIILLPEADRNALIGEQATEDKNSVSGEVLISESLGKISPSKSTSQKRQLEPIRLYSTVESNAESLVSSLSVSRNLIQNNYREITFDVDNLNELEGLGLLFLVSESSGTLKIELNDNWVYEGDLTSNELPLDLPVDYLLNENNVLKLSTNLAWNIFSPSYYLLQDIRLIEDYRVSDIISTRTFSVEDPTIVSSATLNYYITCNADDEGVLTISMNDQELFSDMIFCKYLQERELVLDEDYLRTSNTLKFEINKGDYNIEEIEVVVKTKTRDYPTVSFDVDSDLYSQIISGEKEVYLKLSFGDDSSNKQGEVLVQEYSFSFDTYEGTYEKEISEYIENGVNTLTIEPENNMNIENLKVYVK